MILSAIPIAPPELWSFLGCVLFSLGTYSLLIRIAVDRKKLSAGTPQRDIRPSPLIVKEADIYVLREEYEKSFAALTARLDSTDLCIGEMRDEMRKDSNRLSFEGEARSRRLHERIEAVSHSLGHDIQSMPDRIIGLLKSTGAI